MNTGLSIDPSLLRRGKAKAKQQRQSFSAYVQGLIAEDLGISSSSQYTQELAKRIQILEDRLRPYDPSP